MCVFIADVFVNRAESCVPSLCNSPGAGFVVLKHCAKADVSILVLAGLQLGELWGMCPDFMFSIRVKANGVLTMIPLWAGFGNATMILYQAQRPLHQHPPLSFRWGTVSHLMMQSRWVRTRGKVGNVSQNSHYPISSKSGESYFFCFCNSCYVLYNFFFRFFFVSVMWIIFKVFVEFITILILCFGFLGISHMRS